MSTEYDVIVVGARCAGSATAMLLARMGYRVLVVDKATFPSDTVSTHILHPPGVAALTRWGLIDRLAATGCPPLTSYSFDFGPFRIAGSPRSDDGVYDALCPRRTVLDYLLVEAAVAAGAELRERFSVDDLLVEDGRVAGVRGHGAGGKAVTERARVVVGADGRHSLVAKAVQAPRYHEAQTIAVAYYAYWSGLPAEGFEAYVRPPRAFGVAPTHDDLTMVTVNWPRAEFTVNRGDVEGTCLKAFELVPEFAERIRSATRETRYVGTGDLPNFFSKPYGPGWALVGDAGQHKDPITAQGISDAFRDAEVLVAALDETFSGRRGYDEAMSQYQVTRDERALPMFEFTCDLARLQPPPPEMQQLLAAVATSQEAMDGFVSVVAGTLPVPEFFGPENTARIMSGATSATLG
ncbi:MULTISPECIES: NAD(P)/FAD-dependent oxidoreductase [Nocardioides]|uniref:NAD(P)/FAD-dependent oxidoreductase n=1 Tax=Nocardioides vastitatis TaxID=2568655 RepID=A0ABW0ZEV1_9ACTN|nr:NAD(P)/FAD-dependent oxidoreductase [Nocardioides sp.]THJ14718.1 FAD-dependent monooxygenase [Nocardioides sp.]